MGTVTDPGAPSQLAGVVIDTNASALYDVAVVPLMRRSPVFGYPASFGRFGQPVGWLPSSEVIEEWGTLQLVIAGVDVTYFRGHPTELGPFVNNEPNGDAAMTAHFPQVSWWQRPAHAELEWIRPGWDVELNLHRPGGAVKRLFEGYVAGFRLSGQSTGITLQFVGCLYQADLEPYIQEMWRRPRDIGSAIADILDDVPSRNYALCNRPATGITTLARGSGGSRLTQGVQDLLATAFTDDGMSQWTITNEENRKPTIKLKDRTTRHWTVSMGTPGAEFDLTDDFQQHVNVVYGHGIAPDGCAWYNAKYPTDGTIPYIQHLAVWGPVEPFRRNRVTGNMEGPNPLFEPSRLRVGALVEYGEGVPKVEGIESARRQVTPRSRFEPQWVGSVTLNIDPEEGSRWEMRAGQNLYVKFMWPPLDAATGYGTEAGEGLMLHISQATITPGGSVTLQLSYTAFDQTTLAAVRKRNKDNTDPAKRATQNRSSRMTEDRVVPWDCESGAGFVELTSLSAGTWKVLRVPAGQVGSIIESRFLCGTGVTEAMLATAFEDTADESPVPGATPFAMAVFGKAVTAGQLASTPGNVLTGERLWTKKAQPLRVMGLIQAYGDRDQPAGYWPGAYDAGTDPSGATIRDPLTGKMLDDQGWPWEVPDESLPWVWVAFLSMASTKVVGQFRNAPLGG